MFIINSLPAVTSSYNQIISIQLNCIHSLYFILHFKVLYIYMYNNTEKTPMSRQLTMNKRLATPERTLQQNQAQLPWLVWEGCEEDRTKVILWRSYKQDSTNYNQIFFFFNSLLNIYGKQCEETTTASLTAFKCQKLHVK